MILRILLLPLLLPLSFIFGSLAFFRGLFYSLGLVQTFGFPTIRVVSIGNITSGGTGKTPLSLKLLSEAKRRGVRAAYVSRGFGRESKGYLEISEEMQVSKSGDEALLIKKTIPEAPVAVCENRVTAIEKLLSLVPEGFFDIPYEKKDGLKQLVLADDCFQHRRLRRDLDVVLVDMDAPMWSYLPLPLGFGREGFAALRRAQVVALTRCESVEKTEIISMKSRLVVLGVKNIFESRFVIPQMRSLSGEANNVSVDGPVMLMSSVGNPRSFRRMVEKKNEVLEHGIYPDHFVYDAQTLETMERKAQAKSVPIVVTEKDAVKIEPITKNKSLYVVAQLKMEIDREDEFYDLIFSETNLDGG